MLKSRHTAIPYKANPALLKSGSYHCFDRWEWKYGVLGSGIMLIRAKLGFKCAEISLITPTLHGTNFMSVHSRICGSQAKPFFQFSVQRFADHVEAGCGLRKRSSCFQWAARKRWNGTRKSTLLK